MSLKGKRFRIKDVRLFNVTELDGELSPGRGQRSPALVEGAVHVCCAWVCHQDCASATTWKESPSKGMLFCAHVPSAGTPWGQSAVFSKYELEDGTVVSVQGEQVAPSSIELPPSQEDMAAAEAAVQEQAAAVRALKEGQGLTNADPQVQAAVAELQTRKAALAELSEKYQAALREAEAEAAAPATVESSAEE